LAIIVEIDWRLITPNVETFPDVLENVYGTLSQGMEPVGLACSRWKGIQEVVYGSEARLYIRRNHGDSL
jgi:hypothetical protein